MTNSTHDALASLIKFIDDMHDNVCPSEKDCLIVENVINQYGLPLVVFGESDNYAVALDERITEKNPEEGFWIESGFGSAELARDWAEHHYPKSHVEIV